MVGVDVMLSCLLQSERKVFFTTYVQALSASNVFHVFNERRLLPPSLFEWRGDDDEVDDSPTHTTSLRCSDGRTIIIIKNVQCFCCCVEHQRFYDDSRTYTMETSLFSIEFYQDTLVVCDIFYDAQHKREISSLFYSRKTFLFVGFCEVFIILNSFIH